MRTSLGLTCLHSRGCICVNHAAMFWPNDLPGLGIDVNEAEAAKYPWPTDKGLTGQGTSGQVEWTTVRKRDGSITTP
jgi:hypothetical protein